MFLYSILIIPFRPSLTKDQLHEIGQRRDGRDVPALLWEIARLRAVATRADQLLAGSDPSNLIRTELRRELDECSCVQEMKELRKEFFGKG